MSLDVVALRSSFLLVVERSPAVTARFYEIFFERYPQVRPMFGRTPDAQRRQEQMLTDALVAVLDHLEDAPWLKETLFALGKRHVGYGVRDEMYGWVGECLIAALAEAAGPDWNERTERAWRMAFGAIRDLMIAGAHAARAQTTGEYPPTRREIATST
jgi:hemoglobin-like flavoprotein